MADGALAQPVGILGATIVTRGGTYFDYLEPAKSVIAIDDIAWGLSNTCRFSGHTSAFYSVAQHSVIVSKLVPHEDAFAALMHDAAEAYVGDIPSPLKQLLPEFKVIEKRVETAIFDRFGIAHPLPASVKRADLIALFTEKRDLTSGKNHDWPGAELYPPMASTIYPWGQETAYRAFLRRFHELGSRA